MKGILSKAVLLFSLFFMWNLSAKADHIVGSDITYTSGDTAGIYYIVFNFYRDCNGCYVLGQSPRCGTTENCGSSLTAPTSLSVSCISGTNPTSAGNISLTRTSIVDITATCNGEPSRCDQPCNGTFPFGIEKHTFEGRVDLRSALTSGCCDFEISVLLYVRSADITTGQQQQTFYTSCEINACAAPYNSSPALTNDPVAILCCNQPYTFNNGAIDTAERDSISYSFAKAFRNQNQVCSYNGTRTYLDPLATYYPGTLAWPYCNPNANPPIGTCLDPETGDIIFTPVNCSEVAVVVIQMIEWRKDTLGIYRKIGTTRRDMQFIVMSCPDNNPPTINGPYAYNVCEGSQICFNITSNDVVFTPPPPASAPAPDTVKLTWNGGIPGATFGIVTPSARLQTGRFCWTPPLGTASDLPYTFTVTARDNACPLNAVTVRSFRVRVKHRAEAVVDIDTLLCGEYTVTSTPVDGFRGTPSYNWTLLDSNRNLIFNRKVGYFRSTYSAISTRSTDTILFRKGGTYYIQHVINNAPLICPNTYFDTLVVPPLLETDLSIGPDTFVCAGTDIVLRPRVSNTTPPTTFQWSTMGVTNDGEYLKNTTRDTNNNLDTFVMSIPEVRYDTGVAVLITDGNGCTAEDTVQIFLKANPLAVLPPDQRICSYDSFNIVPNLDSAYWIDPILGDTLVQGDTLYKEWYFANFAFSPFSLADSVTVNVAGRYVIRVYDSLGCADTDTMFLFVNDTVVANAGQDQILCFDDPQIITAGGLDTAGTGKSGLYRWSNITSAPPSRNMGTDQTYTYTAGMDSIYRLDLTVTQEGITCIDDDTVNIFVNQLPIVNVSADYAVCCDAGNIPLNFNIVTPTGNPSTGGWSCTRYPNLVQGNVFYTADACDLIVSPARSVKIFVTYTYTNPTTLCVNRDSVGITVNSLPRIILLDKQYCQDIGSVQLDNDVVISPANTSLGTPSWKCLDSNSISNRFIADMLKNRGSKFAPDWWINLDESSYEIQNTDKDTVVLEFTYINEHGCRNKDTSLIFIWRVPKITFSTNRELCWDEGKISLNTLTGVNLTDGVWTIYDSTGFRVATSLGGLSGDTINTLNSVRLASASATPNRYLIRYDHIATGCPARNDTTLIINPLPVVNITQLAPDRYCETVANMPLNANPAGGTWSSNDPSALVGGNTFSPGNASTIFPDSIHFRYNYTSNVTGCKNVDSIHALVDVSPTITTPTGTEFCRTKGIMTETLQFALTGQNTDRIDWFNFSPGAPRVTMGTVASQNITLNYQADSTEVFRIITNVEGRGSCADEGGFFDITVHPIPQATLTNDNPEGCNPVTTTLGMNITNQVDPTTSNYAWTLGDAGNSTAATANTTITYTTDGQPRADLTITSDKGCDTTLSTTTRVNPIPVANFLPNPDNYTTAALPRFQFNDKSTVAPINGATITDYAWNFGDPANSTSVDQNPSFFYPPDTGSLNVTLTVTTNHGCTNTFSYPVVIGPDLIVFIPNAFTPDFAGPSDNEGFKAHISGEKHMQLTIFNRWGEIMFQTIDKNEKWNGIYKGVPAQQDVYAYTLTVTALNDEVYEYSGTITLIR